MYKVLIIDDEEPVREAVKILGDWSRLGIVEILEACNGREGIMLIREKKPDIVIVDMKMPELNGIDFLKAVEKEYIDALYIVISGYDKFEFTRQAVKSKAVDYLLKPINKGELNDALLYAVESIKGKRKKQSALIERNIILNMSLPSLKEKIFSLAIDGNLNKKIYEDYVRIVDADGTKRSFAAAVLRVMNLDDVNEKYFNNDLSLLYFAVTNVVNEICNNIFECVSIRNHRFENEIIIIITYAGMHKEEINHAAYDVMMKVVRKLEELFEIVSLVGIGAFCSDFNLISTSYKYAKKFLDSIDLLSLREKVIFKETNRQSSTSIRILSIKNMIENAIEGGSCEYVNGIIGGYLDKVVESGYFSLRDASRALNELKLMMSEIALEKCGREEIPKDYENSLELKGISLCYSKFDEYKNILYRITEHFYFKIKQYSKSYENFNSHAIKDYIDNNYFEEIKISTFTEKYYLSREYIMKLFKKEFGCGIHEYALKVRMEKAKELMADPKVKIQNIAQMLGYSDNNYFSKAFKNHFGISPTDYRSSIIKHENI